MNHSPQELARAVLDRDGRTYADESGIRLADQPAALVQLLVLALLLSTRMGAALAVAAASSLRAAGWTTPQRMRDAPRSSVILREVQGVWPWVRPFLDARALAGAERVGLAPDADIATLIPSDDFASFAAALVRLSLLRSTAEPLPDVEVGASASARPEPRPDARHGTGLW